MLGLLTIIRAACGICAQEAIQVVVSSAAILTSQFNILLVQVCFHKGSNCGNNQAANASVASTLATAMQST